MRKSLQVPLLERSLSNVKTDVNIYTIYRTVSDSGGENTNMTRTFPIPSVTKAKRMLERPCDRPPHHRKFEFEKGTVYTPQEIRKRHEFMQYWARSQRNDPEAIYQGEIESQVL